MTEEQKNGDDPFDLQRPQNMDEMFNKVQDIFIVPGQMTKYGSYMVKIPKEALQISNVVAIMIDMTDEHTFQSLELVGIAVVVEINPLILATCERPENVLDGKLPVYIELFNVTSVFAFNMFGVKVLPQIFGQNLDDISEELIGAHSVSPRFANQGSHSLSSVLPAPTVPTSENSYKARKNFIEVQPIKLFFHNDAMKFAELCGPLEDLSSDRTVAFIQKRMPRTYLQFIALQTPNIPVLLKLSFQMTTTENSDLKIKSLHLTHFRVLGSNYKLFYQVKQLFINFTEVMNAIVPESVVLRQSFVHILKMLHSEQEGALKYCDPTLVLNELSERLVNWSGVCASVTAPSDSNEVMLIRLQEALHIDLVLLNNRNMLLVSQKMSKALVNSSDRTLLKRNRNDGQQVTGFQNTPINGKKSYCLAQACVQFLGKGKVYDNKKPLSPCSYQSNCRFEHNFPSTPVSATQKVRLLHLLTLLNDGKSPERLAALTKVMRQPTFSV